jgi:hypothetical protein
MTRVQPLPNDRDEQDGRAAPSLLHRAASRALNGSPLRRAHVHGARKSPCWFPREVLT